MARGQGIEPRFSGPEPDVLPLACPPCLPAGRRSRDTARDDPRKI